MTQIQDTQTPIYPVRYSVYIEDNFYLDIEIHGSFPNAAAKALLQLETELGTLRKGDIPYMKVLEMENKNRSEKDRITTKAILYIKPYVIGQMLYYEQSKDIDE
jgi:hypothetical protein